MNESFQEGCEKIIRQLSSQIGFKFIKLREKVTSIKQSEFYVTIETNKRRYVFVSFILSHCINYPHIFIKHNLQNKLYRNEMQRIFYEIIK